MTPQGSIPLRSCVDKGKPHPTIGCVHPKTLLLRAVELEVPWLELLTQRGSNCLQFVSFVEVGRGEREGEIEHKIHTL